MVGGVGRRVRGAVVSTILGCLLLGVVAPSAAAATWPGAPTIGAVQAGNAAVKVSWTAPASDGGSRITSYLVRAYRNGIAVRSVSAVATARSVTVTGLANGAAHVLTVHAANAVGYGPRSEVSAPVVPATVPGAPRIGAVTAGNRSAVVRWSAPASNGGRPVTGYLVRTLRDGVAVGSTAVPASATSTTVAGLVNGGRYAFTVYATNAVGTGPRSAPSAVAVPATVPGAPTITSVAKGPDSYSAVVRWSPPADTGGRPITQYLVRVHHDGAVIRNTVVGPTARSLLVQNLPPTAELTYSVYAFNALGAGPRSLLQKFVIVKPTGVMPTVTAHVVSCMLTSSVNDNGFYALEVFYTVSGGNYLILDYGGDRPPPSATWNSPVYSTTGLGPADGGTVQVLAGAFAFLAVDPSTYAVMGTVKAPQTTAVC